MLHVILGPPCSGKSTYVSEHARDGDVKVDYDVIATALGSMKPHAAEEPVRSAAYKARAAAVMYLLQHPDIEGWVIHSEPSAWQLKLYKAAEAEIIVLDEDEETCLARAEADDRPPEVIEELHKWFDRHRKGAFLMAGTMKIAIKTVEAKADNGSITGYASTWTREPDSYGDVVKKGAFAECIQRLKDEGRVIPLLYNHNEMDLKNFIGSCTDFKEDEHGLLFNADFDDTEEAQQARKLALDGRLCKFSFAYEVLDQGTVTLEDGREANELRKLNIFEVSLVMYPANQDTSVVEVKSGKRNSAKDEEKLREIIRLAQECLGELDDTDEQDDADAKSKDPDTDNDKELKDKLLKEANDMLTKE